MDVAVRQSWKSQPSERRGRTLSNGRYNWQLKTSTDSRCRLGARPKAQDARCQVRLPVYSASAIKTGSKAEQLGGNLSPEVFSSSPACLNHRSCPFVQPRWSLPRFRSVDFPQRSGTIRVSPNNRLDWKGKPVDTLKRLIAGVLCLLLSPLPAVCAPPAGGQRAGQINALISCRYQERPACQGER